MTALIGGLKLIGAEQATHRVPDRRSVEAAFVEAASYRVGRPEQGGGELRAFFPHGARPGPAGRDEVLGKHGDGVDHVGQRREFYPVSGGSERIREQDTAAARITVRQDGKGQPGLDNRTQPVPPDGLLIVQPGQLFDAHARDGSGIAFAETEFRSHQAEPAGRVAAAGAPLGVAALSPLQVSTGSRQITCP